MEIKGEKRDVIFRANGNRILLFEACDALFFFETDDPKRTYKRTVRIPTSDGKQSIYINLNSGTISGCNTGAIPVVADSEWVIKTLKTQIKAADGITGLTKGIFRLSSCRLDIFIQRINETYGK